MKICLLRHATMFIEFAGKKILLDPVLGPVGVSNPIPTKRNAKELRNPLVDIPIEKTELNQLINSVDTILVTHTHSDHFDDTSGEILPKSIPIICQYEDVDKFTGLGFKNIQPIDNTLEIDGINISRTKCNHGGFFWKKIMGVGSGYVLKARGEQALYITGDTVWCKYVDDTIKTHNPGAIIVYSGGACLPVGRSTTMNKDDVKKVCLASSESQKVIVHMEAINHCLLKRSELTNFLIEANLFRNIHIPNDGETIAI